MTVVPENALHEFESFPQLLVFEMELAILGVFVVKLTTNFFALVPQLCVCFEQVSNCVYGVD